jgi:hypothetical protein
MQVDLLTFLKTGELAGLGPTTTRADMRRILGESDYDGLTSRKHKWPR